MGGGHLGLHPRLGEPGILQGAPPAFNLEREALVLLAQRIDGSLEGIDSIQLAGYSGVYGSLFSDNALGREEFVQEGRRSIPVMFEFSRKLGQAP